MPRSVTATTRPSRFSARTVSSRGAIGGGSRPSCDWRVLAAEGTLLVSVPVEIGVPLLLKQAVRRVAGWRGIGDYPGTSPYTPREYWLSVFAGDAQHIPRPVYGTDGPMPFHDHKGFN